jgi:hypothetical protein
MMRRMDTHDFSEFGPRIALGGIHGRVFVLRWFCRSRQYSVIVSKTWRGLLGVARARAAEHAHELDPARNEFWAGDVVPPPLTWYQAALMENFNERLLSFRYWLGDMLRGGMVDPRLSLCGYEAASLVEDEEARELNYIHHMDCALCDDTQVLIEGGHEMLVKMFWAAKDKQPQPPARPGQPPIYRKPPGLDWGPEDRTVLWTVSRVQQPGVMVVGTARLTAPPLFFFRKRETYNANMIGELKEIFDTAITAERAAALVAAREKEKRREEKEAKECAGRAERAALQAALRGVR